MPIAPYEAQSSVFSETDCQVLLHLSPAGRGDWPRMGRTICAVCGIHTGPPLVGQVGRSGKA